MASGLLSLKWNNHRSTFFHVLSTIRSKESYCDVTIACDGKFYPVHKLVLSTCSDYFEQMFERTNCKHPIIVLKDIRSQELEALLNYMYVGEVNVLQNELAGLIKAAECLMIKGLAVPDEAPSKDVKENKRSYISREDSPVSKRRKRDEDPRPPPSNQHLHREPREHQTQRQSSSASSIPNPSSSSSSSRVAPPPPTASRVVPPPPAASRVAPPPISPAPSAGSASESVSEECSQPQSEGNEPPLPTTLPNAQESLPRTSEPTSSQSSQQSVPEVILDEPGVKEEPQEIQELDDEELEDTKEIFEAHHFEDMGDGDSQSNQGANFDPQLLGSQPQSMEDLVAQAIPGSSGMQGNSVSLWEGDGSFPIEGFTGDGTRQPQMRKSSVDKDVGLSDVDFHHGLHLQVTPDIHIADGTYQGLDGQSGSVRRLCKAEDPSMRSLAPLNLQMYSVSAPGQGHACFLCGKIFGLKHNLYRHLRTHTGERPHQCPHCVYRGTRRSHVLTHINRVHPGLEPPDILAPNSDILQSSPPASGAS